MQHEIGQFYFTLSMQVNIHVSLYYTRGTISTTETSNHNKTHPMYVCMTCVKSSNYTLHTQVDILMMITLHWKCHWYKLNMCT